MPVPERDIVTNWDLLMHAEDLERAVAERDADRRALKQWVKDGEE